MPEQNEKERATEHVTERDIRQEIQNQLNSFELPEYHSIPDVGLFLEQVVRYTGEFMKPIDGQPLTGSMISNYVKHKIIANPVKKLYKREQIASLLFIMIAKTVLSLEDIQLLLSMQQKTYPIETAYEYFRSELKNAMVHMADLNDSDTVTGISRKNPEEKLLVHNIIITVVHKFYLDLYFQKVRES